jgi:hypothetical protein
MRCWSRKLSSATSASRDKITSANGRASNLRNFLQRVGADLIAKYVYFISNDDFTESIDMAPALHPRAILATKYAVAPTLKRSPPLHSAEGRAQIPANRFSPCLLHKVARRI